MLKKKSTNGTATKAQKGCKTMKRQLYVTTKEFESGRHLTGILTEERQETNSDSIAAIVKGVKVNVN